MAADGFITDLKRKFQQGDIVLRLVYVNVAVFLAVTLVQILLLTLSLHPLLEVLRSLLCRHDACHHSRNLRPFAFFRQIAIAESSMSKRAEFLTKYCNIKQNSQAAWLPWEVVEAICGDSLTLEQFRSSYCVGGIDLSQTTDLTACCVVIERDGKLYVICKFFMPANKVDELAEREGVPYRLYISQGLIDISGENFVNYEDCFEWFRDLVERYEIMPLQVGYDRYSAQYLVQQMEQYGFHMDDVYQGENLTPVIHECDGLIRDGTLRLGKNNLLQAHFLNVAMKQNAETRKIRPVKIEERCHIDGFVAVIDALTVRQKWYEQIGAQLKNEE